MSVKREIKLTLEINTTFSNKNSVILKSFFPR
jgi:hypothetical protein